MSVTNIVMLVKDRPALTRQSLQSLYRHTDPAQFTLTVIDDASTAVNYMMLRSLMHGGDLVRVENSPGIVGRARNTGVWFTQQVNPRGDFLYLSDNDVYFTLDWLVILTELFMAAEPTGYRLFSGGTHPFHKWTTAAQVRLRGTWHIRSHDAVSGYSHLMRWDTWDRYGPLDAHAPGTGQSEDWKFCQDIVHDGYKVGSVWPELVYACGLTNTEGQPAVGQEHMPRYPGVIQE